jgi:hypothetical protein
MKTKITFFNSGKSKGVNLDDIDYFYFWENDHRKDSAVYMGLKNDNSESIYVLKKSTDLTKLIRERGVRFYTCDDDYEDGDDYRYGYYYNPSNKDGLDFEPLDQMEGDGHVHMFYKNEEGKYKQL